MDMDIRKIILEEIDDMSWVDDIEYYNITPNIGDRFLWAGYGDRITTPWPRVTDEIVILHYEYNINDEPVIVFIDTGTLEFDPTDVDRFKLSYFRLEVKNDRMIPLSF